MKSAESCPRRSPREKRLTKTADASEIWRVRANLLRAGISPRSGRIALFTDLPVN
jgi:hypothetical protein